MRCVAGKISTSQQHTGRGRPDDSTKENPVLETVRERRLRGGDANKGDDVLTEGGGKVIIRRRRDTVSEI